MIKLRIRGAKPYGEDTPINTDRVLFEGVSVYAVEQEDDDVIIVIEPPTSVEESGNVTLIS